MVSRERRQFLLQSSLATAGLLAGPLLLADDGPLPDGERSPHHRGKVPPRRVPTIRSVQSGDWSQAETWGGKVPAADDLPQIETGHVVHHDVALTKIGGIVVAAGGTLEFASEHSTTLECSGNAVIEGTLHMRPSKPEHLQTLRFTKIDEQRFVGGGMDPLDSDVGLWVVGSGKLSLVGATKTAWTHARESVAAGAKRIALRDASGWRVGDVVMIVPTDSPPADGIDWDDALNRPVDPFASKFERREVTAIEGNNVELNVPLQFARQVVSTDTGKEWFAEVANLSRNVRIVGTESGRAHVFIRSMAPQMIRFVEGQYLGPRNKQPGHGRPQLVLGRYALHFHHCFEGSRDTLVEGCAFYDTANRVYVPHMSHGITMRNNVAFNSMEAAFWWDFQEATHDCLWERNLVALVASNGIDSTTMGMSLGQGDGNIARGNVVVYGHHGDPHGHGSYVWDANNEGVWIFEENLSHSNVTGLFVWQNTSLNHTIVNHVSYNDQLAIFHGAYTNSYTYTGGYIYGGIVRVKATSGNSSGVRFEKVTFDGAERLTHCVDVYPSPVTSGLDTNGFRECQFRNAPVGLLMNTFPIGNENTCKHVDVILCDFTNIGRSISFTKESTPDSWFRIQPKRGQCTRVAHATGAEEIEPFAPYQYGTGTGLTGSYFLGSRFDKAAFTRIDSMIMFQQWSYDKDASPHGVHHLIKNDAYSVRWTGQIEPQFTQDHTFYVQGGGGFRLWIKGRLIIDSWSENADNSDLIESEVIELTAGHKYDIRLETFNTSGARGCQLYWKCAGVGRMVHVPQSQLYPDAKIAR